MTIVVLQLFVSLALVAFSVALFAISIQQKDHEHAERLALAPLDESPAFPRKEP